MHVEDLLRLESLDLTLLWGDRPQLTREITGVTATDLEDPGRFLQRGELVLSGLVWWAPADDEAKAERFVAALEEAGAVALLAGEETHGGVPEVLVEACRRHGIAILSVPVHTSFRAVTDTVYLRQWGDLSRRPAAPYALPENVRAELSRLADGTDPDTLLTRSVAHLGTPPAYVLSATGRTIARTPTAPPLPVRRAAEAVTATTTLSVDPDASAYAQWHLHLPEPVGTPPRMLHEIAEVLAQHRRASLRRETAARGRATDLLALIDTPSSAAAPAALGRALEACGLADQDPYTVITVKGAADNDGTVDALTEALHHLTDCGFAVGRLPTAEPGEATAVIGTRTRTDSGTDPIATTLKNLWPTLQSRNAKVPLHGGISTPAATPQTLKGALKQARYALTAASSRRAPGTEAPTSNLAAIEDLTTLDALLTGIPADVRTAFGIHALGPLADDTNPSHRMLLETLDVFLTHNGSWARTAEALHLHVNTVHYRIQRVEMLTGRDLARLDHKLDLKAALLCR
ncbi:PucR family transcriptional regulator [Streptomyces rubiginosohelvolus]